MTSVSFSRSAQSWNSPGASPLSPPGSKLATTITLTGIGVTAGSAGTGGSLAPTGAWPTNASRTAPARAHPSRLLRTNIMNTPAVAVLPSRRPSVAGAEFHAQDPGFVDHRSQVVEVDR